MKNKEEQKVAAEAYQIIAYMAQIAGIFDHPRTVEALDYFGDIANGEKGKRFKGEILPFPG